jgi:hypothetical protein
MNKITKSDQRITGRTKRISLTSHPKFAKELKKLAHKENCYQIEILEKALKSYKREKHKPKTFIPYYQADFSCNTCQAEFKHNTAYFSASDLEQKKCDTYCEECISKRN